MKKFCFNLKRVLSLLLIVSMIVTSAGVTTFASAPTNYGNTSNTPEETQTETEVETETEEVETLDKKNIDKKEQNGEETENHDSTDENSFDVQDAENSDSEDELKELPNIAPDELSGSANNSENGFKPVEFDRIVYYSEDVFNDNMAYLAKSEKAKKINFICGDNFDGSFFTNIVPGIDCFYDNEVLTVLINPFVYLRYYPSFYDCRNVEEINGLDIDSFVEPINKSFAMMFAECHKLKHIGGLENMFVDRVENFNMMFYNCKSLESIDISAWDTQIVKNIGGMFKNCYSLKTVNMFTIKSFEELENSVDMFEDCTSLKELNDFCEKMEYYTHSIINYLFDRYSDEISQSTVKALNITCEIPILGTNEGWFEYVPGINWNFQDGILTINKWPNIILRDIPVDVFFENTVIEEITGLDNITIYEENIGNAFFNCKNLRKIEGLNSVDVSRVKGFQHMFHGCEKLVELDLSNWNTENATDMSGMFYDCSSLEYLDLANIKTNNVNDFSYMFKGCGNLEGIKGLEDFDTSEARDMCSMFQGCFNLEEINVDNWNTENVTNMFLMFECCLGLKDLNLSNWDFSNVRNVNEMFATLLSLETLDISNFNISDSVNIDNLFGDHSRYPNWNISDIKIPEGFDIDLLPVCPAKEKIEDVNEDEFNPTHEVTVGYESLWYIFKYICTIEGFISYQKIKKVVFTNERKTEGKKYVVPHMGSYQEEGKAVEHVGLTIYIVNDSEVYFYIPKLVKPVLYNMRLAFRKLDNIEEIEGLDIFDTSNMTTMAQAFYGLEKLRKIGGLDKISTENVTNMSLMFWGCFGLTELDLSNFDTSNVESMERMFWGCIKLKTVYVGENWDTSKVTNFDKMFYLVENLKGQKGTRLSDIDELNGELARIDGKNGKKGLFSSKPASSDVEDSVPVEEVAYIKDIKMAVESSKEAAIKKLSDAGYTVIEKNLNEGAYGKHIYLGYTVTTDSKEAIKAIGERWFNASDRNPQTYVGDVQKYEFEAVTDFNGKQRNTNEGTSSDSSWVYLYTSKDANAGSPIKSIEVLTEYREKTIEALKENNWEVVVNSNNGEIADFNRGNYGRRIYIRFEKCMSDEEALENSSETEKNEVAYISEIKMSVNSNKETAKSTLVNSGYTVVETNLNEGTSGKYIYIGYKTTNDADNAIRGIGERWFNASNRNPKTYIGDNQKYNFIAVTDLNGNQWNTNESANDGSRWVYLYTTKDTYAGEPITNIEVLAVDTALNKNIVANNGKYKAVVNSNDGSLADFNRGNKGKKIYIRYQ